MLDSQRNRGFTLVELLVVIAIIGMLVAITVPAISAARESARLSACKHNQHQIWVGLSSHADRTSKYCSGAFSWRGDGAVTEIGWVADLVKQGMLPGTLLCTSNPNQLSQTYHDLLYLEDRAIFTGTTCLPIAKAQGTPGTTLPSGEMVENPCRQMLPSMGAMMAAGPARLDLVRTQIYEPGYNTNYTASWFLVRSRPSIKDGQLHTASTCTASITELHSTQGPLKRAMADSGGVPQNTLPFLACGGPSNIGFLNDALGAAEVGQGFTAAYSGGPLDPSTMAAPVVAAGTPYDGAAGWWATWNSSLQDYRQFGTVHRGSCNILFADGSVRTFNDENRDGLLNNGFAPNSNNAFTDDTVELPAHEVFSRWELRSKQVP